MLWPDLYCYVLNDSYYCFSMLVFCVHSLDLFDSNYFQRITSLSEDLLSFAQVWICLRNLFHNIFRFNVPHKFLFCVFSLILKRSETIRHGSYYLWITCKRWKMENLPSYPFERRPPANHSIIFFLFDWN